MGKSLGAPGLCVLAALLASAAMFAAWPERALVAAPAQRGDCVRVQVWSNGFHVDLALDAALLAEDHPLRRLYPRARSFLIGWGDEAFYRSEGKDMLMGLEALVPPSPSVMHVVAGDEAVEHYFRPHLKRTIGVSHAGAAALGAYLDRALTRGADGGAIVVAGGHLPERSVFLRTGGDFHLFNVCNHWMARALRAAGVDVRARTAWGADGLVNDAARKAPGCGR
ncbi:MAG: DUF2459 domain-containing protein [Hyphomonadaceae bacterium]|nr:DUF2459 domain-containing protein [Hyphomonadaceae bacterium]